MMKTEEVTLPAAGLPPVKADDEDAETEPSSTMRSELSRMLKLGWPNSVSQFFTFLPGVFMLGFLGSDADQLAAAGMAFMFANVTGLSLIIGSGAGSMPLVSQAFGARNYRRCGDLLQRQLSIHVVMITLIALVWASTEDILLMFHQPAKIAALSAQFLRWRIPALPFWAFKEDVNDYLIAQGIAKTPMCVGIVANAINILLYPSLIQRYGFVGAPLAQTLANVLQAILIGLAAKWVLPHMDAWPVWSRKAALTEWGELLRLALPSGVMMLSEWWGWEMNLFFAGMLCDKASESSCIELDVFPIASQTMVIAFMCHFGFSIATSSLVGNALGEGDVPKAKVTCHTCLVLVSVIAGTVALILHMLRRQWGFLFSDDPEIVEKTSELIPLVSLYIFLDALGPGAMNSILRGMGLVLLPAIINFLSFYMVGIPFGLTLTFVRRSEGWGIIGLWAGLNLGMFFMVMSLLLYFFFCADWNHVADVAYTRARSTPMNCSDETPASLAASRCSADDEERQTIGKPTDADDAL
eukprot:TRINITY_DN19610_c0_g1_i1.p1 TRINITY_DN19610_c0_g1~~TRINITY_DN19610_c0_g1_i1.p1  ORF type:complete len:525 (-),score=118.52 TRINITY_DN19610_c0_g1_i1:355-1929(-)